jgi:tetratricopeptide (TPR) repeat protein
MHFNFSDIISDSTVRILETSRRLGSPLKSVFCRSIINIQVLKPPFGFKFCRLTFFAMDKGGSALSKLAQHGMNRGQYQQNQAGSSQQQSPGLNREQEEFSNRHIQLELSQNNSSNNINPVLLQGVHLQINKELEFGQVYNHFSTDQQDNDWTLDFQTNHQKDLIQNQAHRANYKQFYQPPQFRQQPFIQQPFIPQVQHQIIEQSWEDAFKKHQETVPSDEWIKESNKQQDDDKITSTNHHDALAQTAGRILEIVDKEENPKFKKSKFMNMMQQFRDKELHIEGDKVVESVADLRSSADIIVNQGKPDSIINQGTRTHAIHGPTLLHQMEIDLDQSITQNSQKDVLFQEFMQNESTDIDFVDTFPNDPLPSSYKMAKEFSKSKMALQEKFSVGKTIGSPDGWNEEFAAQQDLSEFKTPVPPSVFQNQPGQMFSSDVSHDFDQRELFRGDRMGNLNLQDRDEMTVDELKEAQNVMNEAKVQTNVDQQEFDQEHEQLWENMIKVQTNVDQQEFDQEHEQLWENMIKVQTDVDQQEFAREREQLWETMRSEYSKTKDFQQETPMVQNYNFINTNPFSNLSKDYLTSTAVTDNLTETVLKLEALVQQDPTNGNAWFELGKKQQENENDDNAIEALQKSIELLPNNLDAYLALAVSQTNENDTSSAYQSITHWINHNPKYKNAPQPTLSSIQTHENLVNTLMQFAINNPVDLDADVQTCLGILFNISSEYKKAVDCFEAALQVTPTDYNLWNKLGATLANSGESEKAMEAYFTALELNPRYIRTRYNLGIACMQLGQINEAVGYLLGAIRIQEDNIKEVVLKATPELVPEMRRLETGQGDVLWKALRLFMGSYLFRDDLAEACDRMDLNAFREEFDF